MSAYYFESSARSALGLQRNGNEDSALVSGKLIAVADGMGGHVGGEVASKIAITTLVQLAPMFSDERIDADSIEDLLLHSLYTIDSNIGDVSRAEVNLRGMGTTLTALLLNEDRAVLLHIGDSRCYRLRGNIFEQLSNDHTVLQQLLDQGSINETEAHDHPQRSMLTQVLMGEGSITPVLQVYPLKAGDRFLICSDGLSSVLTEKEIKSIVKKSDKSGVIKALIDATYIKGAPDNVTVIVADITSQASSKVELFGAAK